MSKKKKSSIRKHSSSHELNNSWTDLLQFEDVCPLEADNLILRIVSWNVLAQAYLSRRSHRNLPPTHEQVIFNPKRRISLMEKTLEKLIALELDVLCLQEVDMPVIGTTLTKNSFEGVSTPTTNGGGAGGRVDSCSIYWNKCVWTLINHELIFFDDLSFLGSNATKFESNLQGLKQSLLRRNTSVMVRLKHNLTGIQIVICNAHLYWNPHFDYVKVCQAHYAMQRTEKFAQGDPVIFCGDLNSQPNGPVHEYLTKGSVSAKATAPWYNLHHSDNEQTATPNVADTEPHELKIDQLRIKDSSPQIKYLLDFTLNRFARWLRILGVDAALETDSEEIQRTKHFKFEIFERCRKECRTLITTSSKLLLRKDCPPGTYLIQAKTLSHLEVSLVHLLKSHGVALKPQNFLSRCVVCNGNIDEVLDKEEKKRIFNSYQAPEVADDLECFECDGCGQGYWWCDRPSSSASRVKGQAIRLFEICLRGGVEIEGPLCMFDEVDVEGERVKNFAVDLEMESLQVLDWLKQENLQCPIFLESAYALRDKHGTIVGESKPFTNVTFDFVGFLDYVMFEVSRFQCISRLFLPSSFSELRVKKEIINGHLLPSSHWPSDHLAVGAVLEIVNPLSKSNSGNGYINSISRTQINAIDTVETNEIATGPIQDHSERNEDIPRSISKLTANSYQPNDRKLVDSNPSGHGQEVPVSRELAMEYLKSNSKSPAFQSEATSKENESLSSATLSDDMFCGFITTKGASDATSTIPNRSKLPEEEDKATLKGHDLRCSCGCVPKIPSLFEMAELRKQHRLKLKKELATTDNLE
jgi:uncharacterized protein with PIN domain/mRNA deadenylase 3'-5' endonuclease subunit Ccr4